MNDDELIDRALLRICNVPDGITLAELHAEVSRSFAAYEHDAVQTRIAILLTDGKLRRESDRLWRTA